MAGIEIERYVTTVDGKRYLLGDESTPQIWAVELRIKPIVPSEVVHITNQTQVKETLFLERETLESHGLVPVPFNSNRDTEEPPELTAEDLILQLLEKVGVFPAE